MNNPEDRARPPSRAMLLQWLGTAAGSRKWPLEPKESIVIGRDEDCDIVLDNRLVSRAHAEIFWRDGEYFIRDLDSKNGTSVNGQPLVYEKRLQDGDEVQVALRYKLAFAGEDATADLAWEGELHGISINPELRTASVNGVPVELSLRQFRLLHVLWQAGGSVVTRSQIKQAVWPEAEPDGISRQSIDALVRRMRLTLLELDSSTDRIVTVRHHGYRLVGD